MSELRLSQLPRCFEGLIPCALATATKSGVPNVTYLSQLLYVDESHVGLSRQFFNKTRKNLEENPYACLQVHDALTYEVYQFHVRFERSESAGPLFEEQVARLDAIASHTGMSGVFKLQAIDICEVLRIERVEGFMAPAEPGSAQLSPDFERGPLTELRALQLVSDRMNRARELDELLTSALDSFATWLDLPHSMVLLSDEAERRLTAIASHGYGESGVGAEVAWGDGLIGMAALNRRLIRVSGLRSELRYSLAARERLREMGSDVSRAEVALPGLAKPESQLALPMLVGGELVGVLWFESASGVAFRTWHEAFLQLLANQLAIAIARLREEGAEAEATEEPAPPSAPAPSKAGARRRTFTLFKNDACIYVDGEYLVRNVPGRILWKLLSQHVTQGRSDFNNRELRLDPNLGLPPVRDNLESRLVLLRKRLAEKCPDLQLVPSERGRFRLEVSCEVALVERDHA